MRVPRWRTMIVPPGTSCPPNALTPSRCALESRPLRELPRPFLCAMVLLYLGLTKMLEKPRLADGRWSLAKAHG
jgi:hypothetical protein